MKIKFFLFVLVLIPISLILIVNEGYQSVIPKHQNSWKGVKTINPASGFQDRCSWACHNDTDFCKSNHVKLLASYFSTTDPLYFGIIRSLKATGNYGLANTIVLVLLIPGICIWLFVKSIDYQLKIKAHEQRHSLPLMLPVTTVYVYCTDFVINLSNLTRFSYYEINFALFCVLYPLTTILLIVTFIMQRRRWKRLLH